LIEGSPGLIVQSFCDRQTEGRAEFMLHIPSVYYRHL